LKNVFVRALNYAKFSVRNRGFHYLIGEFSFIIVSRLFRKYLHPTLADFQNAGLTQTYNSEECLQELYPNIKISEINGIIKDFHTVFLNLIDRKPSFILGVDKEAAKLIYCLVRLQKPMTVMETGVANGISTFFILNALNRNKSGKLISIDIDSNVASFLNDNERQRWDLKILDIKTNPQKQFYQIISNIDTLSIYLHDGDHSYIWQNKEYHLALNRLENCGFILSDDIDSSYAFIDFIKEYKSSSNVSNSGILLGQGKIFGFTKKIK